MTRAAEELLIAQPALSQTIARLEDELGVPLFDRLGRRIRLNLFGKAFLERVERIFAELDQGQLAIITRLRGEEGTIQLVKFLYRNLKASLTPRKDLLAMLR